MSEQLNETVDNLPESNVNPFSEESWADVPVNTEEKNEQPNQESSENQENQENQEQESNQDFEQGDSGDEQPSFKYENEISEQIHKALLENKYDDIYSFLEQKNKFEKLSKAEINNRSIAEEIVKAHMKNQYKELTEDEINFKFNKQYSIPKEPVQTLTEDDDEFAERKQEWEQKVKEIDMDLMIQAKTVKPELLKSQQEIKLPSLSSNRQKSPEDLANEKAYVDNYIASVQSSINDFSGINVEYKDEGMSFSSGYVPSVEEKQEVANIMQGLAQAEFDANQLFAERWVNEDYTLNTKQIAEDLWFFQNKDKIIQKLVNDSVSKRISEYRKQTSNISVGSNQANFTPSGEKSESDQMADYFFSN